ncbi:MAG TPA: low molecular weight phosphatase family protein [Methylomirabilota bacterium]|jgi:protein-tyrosine-phosphatase|nr:low molecular weight phosphatase family protein [Methylomirabilota bacterium]
MEQKKTHVLFVCFGNACRSPMAEAIAKSEAADVIEAASAGLYPLGEIPLHTREALKQNGYSAEGLASKRIAPDAWKRADLVINLSGRLRELEFEEYEKVQDWDVGDPYGEDAATYQRILEDIRGRVRDLAQRLREEQRAAR